MACGLQSSRECNTYCRLRAAQARQQLQVHVADATCSAKLTLVTNLTATNLRSGREVYAVKTQRIALCTDAWLVCADANDFDTGLLKFLVDPLCKSPLRYPHASLPCIVPLLCCGDSACKGIVPEAHVCTVMPLFVPQVRPSSLRAGVRRNRRRLPCGGRHTAPAAIRGSRAAQARRPGHGGSLGRAQD